MQFDSEESYLAWAQSQSAIPKGFRVGTSSFSFVPRECPKQCSMKLTLLELDQPSTCFAALFTQNAFPGAPVLVGRSRLHEDSLKAILVNNKVSNVGVKTGVADSERICGTLAKKLSCEPKQIMPSSTGVIGWQLPVQDMELSFSELLLSRQEESLFPAATGIMTTDLYPKVRRSELGGGSIVGIAKGAGMVEPNLATMLVFILTDIKISRESLRDILPEVVNQSFNSLSIDSDQSTSDSVIAVSSGIVSGVCKDDFSTGLTQVCTELSQDIVRNGEGVHHVIEVRVCGAPCSRTARGVGKAIVNSPLVKTAICGNDPNVGRLLMALGNYRDGQGNSLDFEKLTVVMGGEPIFHGGSFALSSEKEKSLSRYMKEGELYASARPDAEGVFHPVKRYPPHQRNVVIEISLGLGPDQDSSYDATVWGGDLTHEYISENADYRS